MDERKIGYVSLSRRFIEDPLWTEDRPKTPFEAWLWLIQAARFEKGQQKMLMGGKVVAWSRGQIPGSLRYLGDQWKWDKNKVDRFLKFLVNDGRIRKEVDAASGQLIITLVNYDKYNFGKEGKRDSKKDVKNYTGSPYDGYMNGSDGTAGEIEWDSKWDSKRDGENQNSSQFDDGRGTVNRTANGTHPGHPRDNTNKDNKGNNGEGTANAEVSPPGEAELFKNFQAWIVKHAPRVGQLKEPFTVEQYRKIRKVYNQQAFTEVLASMHNKATLLKDYTSAYLTCKNWLARRAKDGEKVYNDDTGHIQQQQSKAALIGQQVAGAIRKPD